MNQGFPQETQEERLYLHNVLKEDTAGLGKRKSRLQVCSTGWKKRCCRYMISVAGGGFGWKDKMFGLGHNGSRGGAIQTKPSGKQS